MKLTRTAPSIDLSTRVPAGTKIAATGHTHTATTSSYSSDDDENDEIFLMTKDAAETLVSRTERKVQEFLDNSQWVRNNSSFSQIPRFSASDFGIGKKIAEGGFSDIHEITTFHSHKEGAVIMTGDDDDAEVSDSKKKTRYVVKHLKPNLTLNPHKLRSAAKDICNEIHVLSALHHEHIIQVAGLSSAGISGFQETCRADSFFLILERMDQTLLHKISQWRQKGIRSGSLSLSKLGNCDKTRELFQTRLQTAQQLASALTYLHERRILHRDIKPGNVAFDAEGTLKLIDFGLAVELPIIAAGNNSHVEDAATYHLGNAGTARYQAPEVIQKKPYNRKAETFSFSILLWEIMALTKPYEWLSQEEVKESVAQIGCRPTLPRSWPSALRSLLRKGWAKRMTQRPNMAEMEVALRKIAEEDYTKKKFFFL